MTQPSADQPITAEQLIALSDQLRALVRCGVPLEPGLSALSQEMPGVEGTIVAGLADEGKSGRSLDQWLDAKAERIPPVFRAVVRAGIRAGRLDAALQGFVATTRRAADLRRTVGVALLYPLVVLVLVSLLAGAILQRLTVHYRSMQQSHTITEGSPMHWAIPLVQFVGQWIWILAPMALALAVLWWLRTRRASTLEPGRYDRWMSWLPGAGSMLRYSRRATFSDVLALLIEHDVPLDEALSLAADVSGDRATQREAASLADQIRGGGRCPFERARNGAIAPLVRWLLSSQTDRNQLASALHSYSQGEQRRAEFLAEWLRIQAPVILTLGIGGTATLVYALSVLGPWYGLLREFAQPQ